MKRSTVLAIGLLAIVPFTPALAADHPQQLPGWQPAPFSDFTLPAGSYCPFALQINILENDAIVATTKSFPDGTAEQQVYMGPQLIRLSNAETGKSTVTYIDGILVYDYATDGSFKLTALGKNMAAFRIGVDGYAPGFYFIDGYHLIQYPANFANARQMLSAIGVETNYCQTLSGHRHGPDHD
jgi:hypothetical protein